jgi:PKD repeat protein
LAVFVADDNNLSVRVNASQSTDSDGTITSYAWNFGESASNTASGVSAAHTYAAAGGYTVTLTVTDNAGATAVSQQRVTVPNSSPAASFVAVPNALLVIFDGAASVDSDGSIASYAWNFGEPTSGAANTTTSTASRTTTHAYATPGSYTVTLTVTDNRGAIGVKLLNVTVTPPAAVATGKINDTGITADLCYQAGSDALISCTSAAAISLNNAQDGMQGRDAVAATNSATDGRLGFSFTKIGSSGETLPANATTWNCVKDNVTGMMWEEKTNDGGLRDWNKTYTNYDNTTSAQFYNGTVYVNPTQAQIDAASNSIGFKNAVNAVGLCGARDWRLPTADELQGLLDYSDNTFDGKLQRRWFPNSQGSSYLSSTGYVGSAYRAWYVNFGVGGVYNFDNGRNDFIYVRLVRATE